MNELIANYAAAYRQNRIARGYVDMNLDVVVKYACVDMLNMAKNHSDPAWLINDETEYLNEQLAKIMA